MKLTVKCADGGRYEGQIDAEDKVEITGHGEVSVLQAGASEPIVMRLPSPAVEIQFEDVAK